MGPVCVRATMGNRSGRLQSRWDTDGGDSAGAVAGRFPALLFRRRAVLSAALSRAQILKPLALATVHALAVMVAGLAIRLAFAGVHPMCSFSDFRTNGSRKNERLRAAAGDLQSERSK